MRSELPSSAPDGTARYVAALLTQEGHPTTPEEVVAARHQQTVFAQCLAERERQPVFLHRARIGAESTHSTPGALTGQIIGPQGGQIIGNQIFYQDGKSGMIIGNQIFGDRPGMIIGDQVFPMRTGDSPGIIQSTQ
jgi:hypothetical protein